MAGLSLLVISDPALACEPLFGSNPVTCPNGTPANFDTGTGTYFCIDTQCDAVPVQSCSVVIVNAVAACPDGSQPQANPPSYDPYCTGDQCIATAAKSAASASPATSVTTAITSAVTTAVTIITDVATSLEPTQAGTTKAAGDVSLVAANHQANAGLLLCAQSGNKEAEGDGSGAQDLADCQDYFKKSNELVNMAQRAGGNGALHPDEGMLSDPASVATLEKFQSNFGIDKNEYVRRMLSSRGGRAEFADMLSSKFGEEKLDKLFASAEAAEPTKGGEVAVNETGVPAAKKPAANTSLRDSLKAKLEAADANRKPASAGPAKIDYGSVKAPKESLQPADIGGLVNGSDQEQEAALTIFDVIHQKLQSLREREKI